MKSITITLLLSLWAQLALAWGSVGHRAIAEIAYENLDRRTKKEIIKLLGSDYLPLYANWGDEVRSDKGEYKDLGHLPHYVNMKENETFEMVKDKKYSVYNVYEEQLSILSDKNKTNKERGVALKLLVHLIADMHQPMHCARPDDRGGNDIKVKWFGMESNLHRVWDSDLIKFTQLSYSELAKFSKYYGKLDQLPTHSTDPAIWLNESKIIADDIYKNVGNANFYFSYPYQYLDTIYKQIHLSGIRVANVLKAALK